MKVKKNFQELDLSNAFLFAATMEDPELCGRKTEKTEDELLHKLHERVSLIKQNGEMEAQYMTLEDWMEDMFFEGKTEGRKEGRSEGEADMLSLISAMIDDGREGELPKLKADKAFLDEMKKTYCSTI